MSLPKKFIIIWAGIGIPASIISSVKSHDYFDNMGSKDEINNDYEKVFKNFTFTTWSVGMGLVFGLSWPITYPILIRDYYDKEIDDRKYYCER